MDVTSCLSIQYDECDEHGIAFGIGYSSIRFPTRFEKQCVSRLRVIGKCVAEEL